MRLTLAFSLTAATALSAHAEAPNVVTDIPPVHSIVAAVMGDLGSPVLLLDQGASPHGFQLRPSQVAAIDAADLVVWVGPELTPWLDKALARHDDPGLSMELLGAPGSIALQYHEAPDHSHGDDHSHDEDGHSHDADHSHDHGHDHDHGGVDPHAWLDPHNGKVWAEMIAAELAHRDPDNAATYAANAAQLITAISAAEEQAAAALGPVGNRHIVTFHDAYGYFTARFGLADASYIAAGDAAPPGARHLAELRERLSESGGCLFPEAGQDAASLTVLAEAAGLSAGGVLDPEGALLDPGPELYPALIANLAATIAACTP